MADHDLPRAPPRLARRSYAQRKPRYGLTLDSEPLTALGDYVRERVGTIRGAGTAAKLLQGALAPTTYGQYEVASEHELERLRGSAAIALTSIFAGRQDSAVHLRTQDFGFDQQFIWLRLTEKGKKHHVVRRIVRLPLSQRAVAGHPSALPRVAALLRRYCDARTAAVGGGEVPEFLFQLPGESRPTTRHMEGWLAAALQRLQVTAPEGFAYQGHSLRSMGASSMAAIGVDRHLLNWLGGWARGSSTVEVHYIDPTVLPSPAAYQLYGWALTRQFEADAGVVCRAEVLPDPLLEV